MGTEILSVFILVPVALWLFDLLRIIQRKKAKKHAMLLTVGGLTLWIHEPIVILGWLEPNAGVSRWERLLRSRLLTLVCLGIHHNQREQWP